MKGLAAILGAKGAKPPSAEKPEPAEAEESEGEGGEMAFFKLASEAMAAGDHEAAASALKSGVKACMGGSYGGKE